MSPTEATYSLRAELRMLCYTCVQLCACSWDAALFYSMLYSGMERCHHMFILTTVLSTGKVPQDAHGAPVGRCNVRVMALPRKWRHGRQVHL